MMRMERQSTGNTVSRVGQVVVGISCDGDMDGNVGEADNARGQGRMERYDDGDESRQLSTREPK